MSQQQAQSKVTTRHLARDAYLYVRQSSLRQVIENKESTQRQYALRQRAAALGWPTDRIIVIDSDLGQSGASATERVGFQRLVADVGMGRAGIVLGLEVSRLARNSTDWHRLLEICALTDTLILDEDGIYDPAHFNDRLLLGLKGTMSEAELHLLRARLRGGALNKARRGELRTGLPVGFVYDAAGKVILDPDRQVQSTLNVFFETFERVGSCFATLRHFRTQKLLFPRRVRAGSSKGDLVWIPLTYSVALHVLHNPRYAGAYAYGRIKWRKTVDGRSQSRKVPRDEWITLQRDAHAGYITWEQYDAHERRLRECSAAYALEQRRSPPREGPSLLQGIVVCGRCGARMTVRYGGRSGRQAPVYLCQRRTIEHGEPLCQSVPGRTIDAAIGELLLETLSPLAIDVALEVHREMLARVAETDQIRVQHRERQKYEADVARRRFMQVDPGNRLVADTLEAEWNNALRELARAEQELSAAREHDRNRQATADVDQLHAIAKAFPSVWRDRKTPARDQKRMVRLVIEDATILKSERITIQIRFRGGATSTIAVPRPLTYFEERRTQSQLVTEIDELLAEHHDGEVAQILIDRGRRPGGGGTFDVARVAFIRTTYELKSFRQRLLESGYLSLDQLATRYNVTRAAIKRWRERGLVRGRRVNDKDEFVYEDPGNNPRVRRAAQHAARIRPVPPGSHGFRVRGAV
jgi:DNA invertase Pin-like site-specific DNA recombinase